MLQNWVGNGIGSGSSPLTVIKIKDVNLVIFWKQEGNSSSIFKDQKTIEKLKESFFKPGKVKFDKESETKLDKLEKFRRTIYESNRITLLEKLMIYKPERPFPKFKETRFENNPRSLKNSGSLASFPKRTINLPKFDKRLKFVTFSSFSIGVKVIRRWLRWGKLERCSIVSFENWKFV